MRIRRDPQPRPDYVIHLDNIVLPCRIGVHAHERHGPQRVRIDLALTVRRGGDGGPATDDIGTVPSYDDILAGLRRVVDGGHVALLETLAEAVATACLEDKRIRRVRVSVGKPDVFPDSGIIPSVRIDRSAPRTAPFTIRRPVLPTAGPAPWVVKIGDGPAQDGTLTAWLDLLARAGRLRPVVLVPGGGAFADAVRDAQDQWRLDPAAAHRMALLAMDQYGVMMQGLCPSLHTAGDEGRLRALVRAGLPTVWLPSAMAQANPEIAGSWDVDGDSLAAWLAIRLNAEALVLVTSGACPCGGADPVAMARNGVVDAAFPSWRARFPGAIWCVHHDRIEIMETALTHGVPAGCSLPRHNPRRDRHPTEQGRSPLPS